MFCTAPSSGTVESIRFRLDRLGSQILIREVVRMRIGKHRRALSVLGVATGLAVAGLAAPAGAQPSKITAPFTVVRRRVGVSDRVMAKASVKTRGVP